MGTAEEDARNSLVESLLDGDQKKRDKFIISTLIDIKENGCAKACSDNGGINISKTTLATLGTFIATLVYGVIEGLKAVLSNSK